MNFSTVSEITIPEGRVNRILDTSGTEIWKSIRLSGPPTAVLYDDGTMIFQSHSSIDESIGTVVKTYTGWDTLTIDTLNNVPWVSNKSKIKQVSFKGKVSPISMRHWFADCSNLTSITFDGLDASNVTDMYNMFNDCTSLVEIDLSGLDTSNVTTVYSMFSGCTSLESANFTGLNLKKVTNMAYMFQKCSVLDDVSFDDVIVRDVTDMKRMFEQCTTLQWIDLCSLVCEPIEVDYMFYKCSALSYLDVSGFDFGNVTSSSNMLNDCDSSDLDIYVADSNAADFVESTSNFPSTATIYVPDEDGVYNPI